MLTLKATSLPSASLLPFLHPLPLPSIFSIHRLYLQTRLASTGPQYRKQKPSSRPSKSAAVYRTTKKQPPSHLSKPFKPPPPSRGLYPSPLSRPPQPGDPPLTPLPYHVHRTASQQLPIYNLAKRGGNLHQTRIRKIEGDVDALRRELMEALGRGEKEVVINRLTGHIVVKVSFFLSLLSGVFVTGSGRGGAGRGREVVQ